MSAQADIKRTQAQHHETANDYKGVIAQLCSRHRVIECKDGLQWILQGRDAQRAGQPRWKGLGYFRTRDALVRVSRATCVRIDPAAMAILLALPSHFGGST